MSGKTTTKTQPTFQTQSTTPNAQAMEAYTKALQTASNAAATPFQTYSTDPSAFVAQLNPTQTGAISNISGLAGGTTPAFNAAYGLTSAGATPTYQTVGNYMNPYMGSVVAPTMQYLQQQQGQDLAKQQAQAIQAGAFGGDRAGIARATLQGQQQLAQGQTLGGLLQQGYGQALGAAQQGANQALQAGAQFGNLGTAQQQAALQQAQAQLGAGTTAQQTQQAGLSALYNQFLQSVAYPFQTSQFLTSAAGSLGPLMGSSTSEFGLQQTTQPAPFFSDKRLKKNIKKVGKLNDGQPVYKYDYGDGRTQLGLMAQDVEKSHPEAVGLSHGYKTVDYDEATKNAERSGKFYGGGLVPSSMGGAVMPGMERERFDYGGMPGSDIASILAAQAAFLPGAKGGGQGFSAGPTGQSYVPASTGLRPAQMPTAQLNLTPQKTAQQDSAFKQAVGDIKGVADLGSSIKSIYQGGKGLFSEAKDLIPKGAGAAAPAPVGPMQLGNKDTTSSGPSIDDTSYKSDFDRDNNYRGGGVLRDHYADGGVPGETDGPSYFPKGVLEAGERGEIASGLKAPQLNLTGGGGSGGGSGGGLLGGLKDVASLGSSVASIGSGVGDALGALGALFLSSGGVAGHRGNYAGGGDVAETPNSNAPDPVDYMARTMVREAGDQGEEGLSAVGHVIKNRLNTGRWGKDISSVVTAPDQFTPWNEDLRGTKADPRLVDPNSPIYQKAYGLAKGVLSGDIKDPTGGALNFYNPDLASPKWGPGMANTVKIGQHVFGTATGGNDAGGVKPMAYAPASEARPGFFDGATKTASDTGDWFEKNQKWLVPLLSGIGTMASSPSRYLGAAVLQGLGGGAQSYAQMQKQAADIERTKAATEQTYAQTVGSSIKYEGGRTFIRAVGPQGYYWMPFNDWWALDPKNRPTVDPRAVSQALQMEKGRPPDQTGVYGRPTTPATPAPTPATQAAPAPVSTPAAPTPATPPTAAAPAAVPATFQLTPEEKASARSLLQAKSGWETGRLEKEPDYLNPQIEIARNLESQKQILIPLAGTLADLPEKGLNAPGKAQEVFNPAIRVLNNLAGIAGMPDLITDPKQIASTEEIEKLTNQLQKQGLNDTQLRAVRAFDEMAKGMASLRTSKEGASKLVPQMLTNAQREIDRNQMFKIWGDAATGGQPKFKEWEKYVSKEANDLFDKKYGNEFYSGERKNLENMFKTTVKDEKTGKQMSLMTYLANNPTGLRQKDVDYIKKTYGSDILRYFGINR
jgi:hypothetical protein